MFSKAFSVATIALAASAVVDAQTYTDCNPTQKTCPAAPALGKSANCDFSKGPSDIFKEAAGTKLDFSDKGAEFSIKTETNAPTISSDKYIFFGKVEVEVQAAPGAGIVTSVVLQSADLDEIDWEWVGSNNTHVQTNYFSKGDVSTYDRGGNHAVDSPTTGFHTYTVEWTSKAVNWIINGKTVRTLSSATVKDKFPQTPMQIKLGTWCAGGKDSKQGTRDWAGGYTDFSKAPFNAYYKSISIVDYAGKDSPANGGVKEYIYGDQSGSWESIKVVGGSGSGDSSASSKASSTQAKTESSASGSATSSATKTSDNSKTDATNTMSTAASSGASATDSASVTNGPSGTANVSTSGRPTSTAVSAAASRGSVAMTGALLVGVGAILALAL